MNKELSIKNEYNSLDKILGYIKNESPFEVSLEYDHWDVRTDANNQMEQCILIKKSAMHGVKMYLSDDHKLTLDYVIPNKIMNAYFGKSQKRYQNILEIIGNKIKELALEGSQQKAFDEISGTLNKIIQ
jgi:hypothetical protein